MTTVWNGCKDDLSLVIEKIAEVEVDEQLALEGLGTSMEADFFCRRHL